MFRDLAKHRGVHHPFLNEILPLVPAEKKKEVLYLLKAPQNFLKHATTDPDESMTLNPESTELLLFEAARAHFTLVGYEIPETWAVFMWVCLKHPDLVMDGPLKDLVTSPLARSMSLEHPDVFFTWIAAQQRERDAARLANPKLSGREKQRLRAGAPLRVPAPRPG